MKTCDNCYFGIGLERLFGAECLPLKKGANICHLWTDNETQKKAEDDMVNVVFRKN